MLSIDIRSEIKAAGSHHSGTLRVLWLEISTDFKVMDCK